MIADFKVNFGDKDIGTRYFLDDVSGDEAFKQSLVMRLMIERGSFLYDESIGSRLHTIKKNTTTLQEDIVSIIQEAWTDYFATGEISEFKVENVNFDNTTKTVYFSIKVYLPSERIITITNQR